MPDHVHLLVHGGSESADCKQFIVLGKRYSGYVYAQEFGGKLWQRYGYERTLRQEEDSLTVARYILENPVRAQLAACVAEYPYVGSTICSLEDLIVSLPHASLVREGPAKAGHYVR